MVFKIKGIFIVIICTLSLIGCSTVCKSTHYPPGQLKDAKFKWSEPGKGPTASIAIDLASKTIQKSSNWKPRKHGQEKGEALFTVYRMPDKCDDEDPSHQCWVHLIIDDGMGGDFEVFFPPGCNKWGH